MVKVFLLVHSGVHRIPMPSRLLPLSAPSAALLLLMPAGAFAADYVPDQVIVKYAEGVGGGVAANWRPTRAPRRSPGCAAVRAAADEDGQSVRRDRQAPGDPNVDYAVPN